MVSVEWMSKAPVLVLSVEGRRVERVECGMRRTKGVHRERDWLLGGGGGSCSSEG